MNSGIYKITNTTDGKLYVGAAAHLAKRKTQHFRDLRVNKHCNKYLQHSYNKYGLDVFVFEVLEYCPTDLLAEREQYYITLLEVVDKNKGYNIAPVAYSCLGIKRSDETKLKLASTKQGLSHPKADRKIHTFAHKVYGIVQMTQIDFYRNFNLNRGGVSSLVKGTIKSLGGWRLNFVRNINSKKLSDEDICNMKDDYSSGMTIVMVAKKYKVARNTAYERLKEAGMKKRNLSDAFKLKRRFDLDCPKILDQYNNGYSLEELMAAYSLSNTSLRNIIKDYGGKFRSSWETRRMKTVTSQNTFESKAACA